MNRTIGVERERFIINEVSRKIVNAIDTLLPEVRKSAVRRGLSPNLFGYELFAGQIEDRTPVCDSLPGLQRVLDVNDKILSEAGKSIGLDFCFSEFVEENEIGTLEVNPFDVRHQKIWEAISQERRLAASRVIATHVHIGVSQAEALKLFSICNKDVVSILASLGDHSNGKRMVAYKAMAQTDGCLPKFHTFNDLLAYIEDHGGEKNVWDLVRYKPSTKTMEFRMFGSTPNVEEVIEYAKACLQLLY